MCLAVFRTWTVVPATQRRLLLGRRAFLPPVQFFSRLTEDEGPGLCQTAVTRSHQRGQHMHNCVIGCNVSTLHDFRVLNELSVEHGFINLPFNAEMCPCFIIYRLLSNYKVLQHIYHSFTFRIMTPKIQFCVHLTLFFAQIVGM